MYTNFFPSLFIKIFSAMDAAQYTQGEDPHLRVFPQYPQSCTFEECRTTNQQFLVHCFSCNKLYCIHVFQHFKDQRMVLENVFFFIQYTNFFEGHQCKQAHYRVLSDSTTIPNNDELLIFSKKYLCEFFYLKKIHYTRESIPWLTLATNPDSGREWGFNLVWKSPL